MPEDGNPLFLFASLKRIMTAMDEKPIKSRANYILLVLTIFLRWFGDSLFYAFVARYMKELPFASLELSILTMAIPVMGMLGSIMLTLLGNSFRRRKAIYIILFSMECVVVSLFGFHDQFWYVLLFDMIANFCTGPSFSIIDTFIVGITDQAKKSYASARRFGTLGYIAGVFGGGYLISFLSEKWTFFLGGGLMLLASILFLCLRFEKQDIELIEKREEKQTLRGTFSNLMKNRNYVFFLLALSLSQGMMLATDTAFSLYSVDLGISDAFYGYAFGSAIVMEFLLMLFFWKNPKESKMKIVLFVGAIAQVIRPILFAIPFQNPNTYLFFACLRGVSMGFYLLAQIDILRNIVGDELLYPGYFFFALIKYVLTAAINFLVPLLSESGGYSLSFLVLAIASFLGLLFLFPMSVKKEATPKEA